MPATEQTWRNLKILHVVFGLVAIVLLLATVLMPLGWEGPFLSTLGILLETLLIQGIAFEQMLLEQSGRPR